MNKRQEMHSQREKTLLFVTPLIKRGVTGPKIFNGKIVELSRVTYVMNKMRHIYLVEYKETKYKTAFCGLIIDAELCTSQL